MRNAGVSNSAEKVDTAAEWPSKAIEKTRQSSFKGFVVFPRVVISLLE